MRTNLKLFTLILILMRRTENRCDFLLCRERDLTGKAGACSGYRLNDTCSALIKKFMIECFELDSYFLFTCHNFILQICCFLQLCRAFLLYPSENPGNQLPQIRLRHYGPGHVFRYKTHAAIKLKSPESYVRTSLSKLPARLRSSHGLRQSPTSSLLRSEFRRARSSVSQFEWVCKKNLTNILYNLLKAAGAAAETAFQDFLLISLMRESTSSFENEYSLSQKWHSRRIPLSSFPRSCRSETPSVIRFLSMRSRLQLH